MKRIHYILIGFFMAISTLVSCTSENDLNSNIIPNTDSLQLQFSDTTTLITSIERDDTLRTDATERVLLGAMYDPIFGKTTSSFYSTFTIAQSHYPTSDMVVDSVLLTMRADGGYGDLSKFTGYQVLEVFELTEDIPDAPTGGYNSLTSFTYNPIPLATYGYAPQFFPQGTEPAAIRVKLNPTLATRFFVPGDTVNSTKIRDYLKGIYVRTHPSVGTLQSPGQGGIAYFKLNSDVSNLKIYWHSPTTPNGQLKFPMGTSSNKRVNIFTHDYSSGVADAALINKLGNPADTSSSDKLYIHALEGIRIKVKMPYLKSYLDSGKIIVNRAEFVIPVDPTQNLQLYREPSNLMAYYIASDGKIHFMDDIIYTYYDSFYDGATQQYKIVITQYIQQVLNNTNVYDEFYFDIPVLSKYTDAFRLVVNSTEHATNPMRLNLTYTRIPTE